MSSVFGSVCPDCGGRLQRSRKQGRTVMICTSCEALWKKVLGKIELSRW